MDAEQQDWETEKNDRKFIMYTFLPSLLLIKCLEKQQTLHKQPFPLRCLHAVCLNFIIHGRKIFCGIIFFIISYIFGVHISLSYSSQLPTANRDGEFFSLWIFLSFYFFGTLFKSQFEWISEGEQKVKLSFHIWCS